MGNTKGLGSYLYWLGRDAAVATVMFRSFLLPVLSEKSANWISALGSFHFSLSRHSVRILYILDEYPCVATEQK
jgi:hypothetical protein